MVHKGIKVGGAVEGTPVPNAEADAQDQNEGKTPPLKMLITFRLPTSLSLRSIKIRALYDCCH
ncbi:hypothetical protein M404DRAFT_1006611 [Pisolithus tinctorius Marx 270]|uniref:Uncharacterized protein n=1 Tax=Pisolithus tinctorius Marx 270 TaxID=870435 RepID=A0A0C3JG35_PISTI|nr:hypothetical protein M404DRAFT_1006611 [Pisolithus tinctorius Marx 270]